MNSIAGVAVAVALVPPLAVVGVGLTVGPVDGSELHHSLKEAGLDADSISISRGAFLVERQISISCPLYGYVVMHAVLNTRK